MGPSAKHVYSGTGNVWAVLVSVPDPESGTGFFSEVGSGSGQNGSNLPTLSVSRGTRQTLTIRSDTNYMFHQSIKNINFVKKIFFLHENLKIGDCHPIIALHFLKLFRLVTIVFTCSSEIYRKLVRNIRLLVLTSFLLISELEVITFVTS
jgi:hypothetical protein